jgi:hypothetical protein
MDKLFLTILNMSLTGAFVIAAICLARLPLKKAPKIISYCLWAVALTAVLSIGFTQADKGISTETSIDLPADEGAQPEPYEPREWLNYFYNDELPWSNSFDLELLEYPDTIFRWTPEKVVAITPDGESELFYGMPVWNVYLTDLTGDGLPEFCATISIGSGIIDNRVVAYDYSVQKAYELSDRMKYDYSLSLVDGRLIVTKTEYNSDADMAAGELAIVKGELVIADTIKTEAPT